jgi:hypothetical protein
MNPRSISILLAATAFLLSSNLAHAVNPPYDESEPNPCDCPPCEGSCGDEPVTNSNTSVNVELNVGRSPFQRPNSFSSMFATAGTNVGETKLPQGLDGIRRYFEGSAVTGLWSAPLVLKSDVIDASVFTPSSLTYNADQKMEVLKDNGVIRQVLTHDFLVDIRSFTDFNANPKQEGYIAKWYYASSRGVKFGGFYSIPVSATPVKTVTIRNPTPQIYNTLDVFSTQETPDATSRQILHRYVFETNPANGRPVHRLQTWTTDSVGTPGTRIAEDALEYISGSPGANAQTRIRTLSEATLSTTGAYGSLETTSRTREEYEDVGGLKRLVSKTLLSDATTDTAGLTTTYGYYNTPTNAFLNGRPQWQINPDGSWTIWRITGNTDGPTISEITPFLNTAFDLDISADLCRAKTQTIRGSWMETSVRVLGKLVEHEEEEFFNGAATASTSFGRNASTTPPTPSPPPPDIMPLMAAPASTPAASHGKPTRTEPPPFIPTAAPPTRSKSPKPPAPRPAAA